MEEKNTFKENGISLTSRFFALSEKLASWGYLRLVLLSLLPFLILMMYPVDRSDYDLWWQMALGRYYLTHHTLVIDHSIFSWTPADSGWIYNTFLGSIVIYLLYNWLGGFGLWLLQWMVFLGIFFAFYVFLKIIKQPLDITAITVIAAIGIACSVSCSFYKPELFSPLILTWIGVIYIYVKVTRRKLFFYIYPPIFALWVNLHGGFIIGYCLLAGFCIGELLNSLFFPRESFSKKDVAHLWIASFLSFAATFLNPYGANYLLNISQAVISPTYTVTSKNIQAYVSLWPYFKSVTDLGVSFFKMGQVALIMAVMLLALTAVIVYDLIKNRFCDFTGPILTAATFIGSMSAVRAIYMFPIFFFVSFFYLLFRMRLKNVSARASAVSLLIFILLVANVSYFTFRYGADDKWFGSGLDNFAPVKEVSFLKKYRLPEPIFNDYIVGGYLLWALYPDYKVFIDPRLGPYCGQVAPDYWEFVNKPEQAADIRQFNGKYPFKTAIIHYRDLPLIFDFLSAGWRLLYFEKNAAILVHPSILLGIPPELKDVDLGPARFTNEKNPEVLLNVFSIYVNLNPRASRVIYEIYKRNVSDCYKPKAEHLKVMEDDMKQKGLHLLAE